MSSPSGHRQPFALPLGVEAFQLQQIKERKLDELYELNRREFLDIVAILYYTAMNDPDPGALADPKKGFDSFCELLTEYFLAAPSSTLATAKDEDGNYVNFFGKVIANQLGPKLTSQELYDADDSIRYSHAWKLVKAFVRYIVLRAFFDDGLASKQQSDIAAAEVRIEEIRKGTKKLRCVPEGLFH